MIGPCRIGEGRAVVAGMEHGFGDRQRLRRRGTGSFHHEAAYFLRCNVGNAASAAQQLLIGNGQRQSGHYLWDR